MNNEYRKDQRIIAVLGYHKVGAPAAGGWETWSYVPETVFKTQLDYLKNNDWRVISVETFKQAIDNPGILPEKTVLITFDDGYRSNLEMVVPILQQYKYPAVIFVPTAFVGGYNAFDADIFYEPKEAICSWEELKELDEKGMSVQSHGVIHPHFSRLSKEALRTEVIDSRLCLEKKLGKTIDMFSFPYGDKGLYPDETDLILKEAGYKAAFLYGAGGRPVCMPISLPYQIMRVPIGPDTDIKLALEY